MVQANRISHTPTPSVSGTIGVRCGRYELVAKVGHGGMADVFLGVAGGTAGFRKLTVIKRMHPELLEEGDFREMFLDEARLAARLNHPNIVQTQEVDTAEDGVPYIAMEFLEGQSLDKVIREALRRGERLSLEIVFPWILGVLDALSYAHTLQDYDGSPLHVVHRDISPSNLFISYDGTPRLLDFGIAKAATQVAETQTGQIKGKFSYMAPEQARGEVVDGRADLWSMGVVMWECLSGERLFKERNHLDTIRRVLAGDVPPLETKVEIPEDLVDIIDRALSVRRADRWDSAEQMRDALTRWQREAGFHPASQRELGRFMVSLFEDRIQSQKEQIRVALEAFDARESMSSERSLISFDDSAAGMTGARSAMSPPPAPRSKLVPVLGAALLLTLGVLAGTMWMRQPAESASNEAGAPTAAQAPGESETAAEARVEAPPTPAPVELATEEAAGEDEVAEAEGAEAEGAEDAEEDEEAAAETAATRTQPRRRWRPRATMASMTSPAPAPMEAEAQAPPTPAVRETGRLSIVTTPWSEVYLGSRRIGQTPLIGLELPAGRHVLTLRNPEEGIQTRYPVTIHADQHERVRISLR